MNKNLNRICRVAAIASLLCTGFAMAQSSSSSSSSSSNLDPRGAQQEFTGRQSISLTSTISSAVTSAFGSLTGLRSANEYGTTGRAAAGFDGKLNVWGALGQTDTSLDFAPVRSNGRSTIGLIGVDYMVAPNALVGVVVSPGNPCQCLISSHLIGKSWASAACLTAFWATDIVADKGKGDFNFRSPSLIIMRLFDSRMNCISGALMKSTRRSLLQAGAAAALAATTPLLAQPLIMSGSSELMPKSGKRRVVVLGGGWGGLTTARHVREQAPDLEVVVIERNPVFWSCPLSNKWLIDVVDTNFLVHSYMNPARRHGYTFVQAEITEIDRSKRRVHTAQGHIDYDWLVISAGIRYGFEAWFGNDRKAIEYTRTNYATAYIPSAEHALVKQKIHNFKGGTFVMTLPPPPHRCPPSLYERACLMAWLYQSKKINAKIVILDPKPRIAPITAGFAQAFKELYPNTITHVPGATIKEVDPFNKVVKTAAGDFKFDDALLMSPHQAADLVWKADLIGKTPDGKPTGWAGVHPLYYNAPNDPQVFVIGDSMGAVSPQFGHYPKAGHVANKQGQSVAKYIAAQAKGQELKPIIIDNLCYMLVNNSPREAIAVQFDYKIGTDGLLFQTQIDDNERREELWKEDLRWVGIMFKDFVAG